MLLELCKGVHCVDLGESFQTHIYLQNLASIQPRTSPLKFAAQTATNPSLPSLSRVLAPSARGRPPRGAAGRRSPRGPRKEVGASGKQANEIMI